jgi:hypothetical protein
MTEHHPEHSWDDEIELRKEPYRQKVGDYIYEYEPELDADRWLEAYANVQAVRSEAEEAAGLDDATMKVDRLERLMQASYEFVAPLMLPESRQRLLAYNEWKRRRRAAEDAGESFDEPEPPKPPPERALAQMVQKAMEHYGMRPTGPSSGSQAGSSRTGRRSTGSSRSKA